MLLTPLCQMQDVKEGLKEGLKVELKQELKSLSAC